MNSGMNPTTNFDFKEENTDEMLENGYVLNTETGKWEKPSDKT
jgi:hypothetical protein